MGLLRQKYVPLGNFEDEQSSTDRNFSDKKNSETQKNGLSVQSQRVKADDREEAEEAVLTPKESVRTGAVSYPLSVMRPQLEEVPNKNVTGGSRTDATIQPDDFSDKQSSNEEKPEAALLLLTDKKGKQVKLQSTVSWSLNAPHSKDNPLDETALVGNFKTDDGKLSARMSIRKNYRNNLGATHLIDLSFSQSDNFDGGVVVDVKGIYYGDKTNVLNKQAATIVADLYENNFVASLRDDEDDKETNRNFLTRSAVIGFQTVFTDGKTALFMLNKSASENRLFDSFNAKTTH